MHSYLSAPHPIAFASLPWQLVLGFIVFNIVAGMISKRKQKQAKPGSGTSPANPRAGAGKAEVRRDREESRDAEIRRSREESRMREEGEAKRKAAELRARRAREEVLRARDEEWDSRESGETETAGDAASSGEAEAGTASARREPAKPAGRGLLDQLARELGLELPETRKPVPAAVPRPSAKPAQAQSKRSKAESAEVPGAPAPMAAPVPTMPQAAQNVVDFSDPEAMRKAFILKVILDKPVSRRPHR